MDRLLAAAPCSKEPTIWGFPKIRGTILGVPIIRTIVFWSLYWGPPILRNYHIVALAGSSSISLVLHVCIHALGCYCVHSMTVNSLPSNPLHSPRKISSLYPFTFLPAQVGLADFAAIRGTRVQPSNLHCEASVQDPTIQPAKLTATTWTPDFFSLLPDYALSRKQTL